MWQLFLSDKDGSEARECSALAEGLCTSTLALEYVMSRWLGNPSVPQNTAVRFNGYQLLLPAWRERMG